jgi:hypothetical protein
MENVANETVTYKDVVFKYAVDVKKDKEGRIKRTRTYDQHRTKH